MRDEAERQWASPGAVQEELRRLEELREAGEIDEDEARRREEELVDRLLAGTGE